MVRFESSTSIALPVEEVFDFVTDVRNDPKWHTDILEVAEASGAPVGQGPVFDIRLKPFMGNSEGTIAVAELQRPRRAVLKAKLGKMPVTLTYSFEADGAGTRFTRAVEVAPPGVMGVMAPLMKGMMRKRNAGFLANLKRVMESTG